MLLAVAKTVLAIGACAVSDSGPQVILPDVEPNDTKEELVIVSAPADPFILVGKLEKRYAPDYQPDTYMILFDKLNNFVLTDDNGAIDKGNGLASGLYGITDADGFIDNGDDTHSIRIGVTGRADGLDSNFNGLNQNAGHEQFGAFTVYVAFHDAGGSAVGPTLEYTDEFIIGAEAFYINYIVPDGAVSADVWIDNTVGEVLNCSDVDYFLLEDLVPFCEYCITTVGGLDCECRPTDTLLGWFDKNMNLIDFEDENGPVPGYARLCVTADVDGRVRFAVTGSGDENFDGYLDGQLLTPGAQGIGRAPAECPDFQLGHGVGGCYTLEIIAGQPHDGGSTDPLETQIEEAMSNGDINMNGVTDTADLGILLGNFGWTAPPTN